MQQEIPVPIMFRPLKHHLYFLQTEIKRWKNEPWQDVYEELLQVGDNLIDFYTGTLTVEQICTELLRFFAENNLLAHESFVKWLPLTGWKKVCISDRSEWLIKLGKQGNSFIHVHPAKYSRHGIRVRANSLKTVLALQIQEIRPEKQATSNLENVNFVRKKLLGLSPIKSLHSSDSGIMRLWILFNEAAL